MSLHPNAVSILAMVCMVKLCLPVNHLDESVIAPNDINKMFQYAEGEEYSSLPYITAHPRSQWSGHGKSTKRE